MALARAEVWTIDELAQRAGCSVDTVRFYTRQGLLPDIERRGRSVLYGQPHLDRLRQIQSLQARHFTLAAIKDLAEEGRLDLLESFFGESERRLTRQELLAESGVDPAVLDQLEIMGFLPAPKERGAPDFDVADLRALRAVTELLARGMPPAVLLSLARIYLQQMSALQRRLLATFLDPTNLAPDLSAEEVDNFITLAANDIDELIDLFDMVVQYLHRHTLQSLVVEAIEIGQEEDDPE